MTDHYVRPLGESVSAIQKNQSYGVADRGLNGYVEDGVTWSASGATQIVSGKIVASTDAADIPTTALTFTPYIIELDISSSENLKPVGFYLRYTDTSNYVRCSARNSGTSIEVKIRSLVAGVQTDVTEFIATDSLDSGYTIVAVDDVSSVSCWLKHQPTIVVTSTTLANSSNTFGLVVADTDQGATRDNLKIVDNAGYGLGNGLSYTDAFNGFRNIAWGSIIASDVLYVAGTHTEKLDMQSQGVEGLPITVRGDYATDAGVIDGQNLYVDIGIENRAIDYVDYKKISLLNSFTPGSSGGNGMFLWDADNINMSGVISQGSQWNGVDIKNSSNCTLSDSYGYADWIRSFSIAASINPTDNCWIKDCTVDGAGRRSFNLSGDATTRNVTNSGFINCHSKNSGGGFQIDSSVNSYMINCSSANEVLTGLDPFAGETHLAVEIIQSTNLNIIECSFTGNTLNDIVDIQAAVGGDNNNLNIQGTKFLKDSGAVTGLYSIAINGTKTDNLKIAGCEFTVTDVNNRLCVKLLNNIGQNVSNNTFIGLHECLRAQAVIDSNNLSIVNNIYVIQGDSGTGFVKTDLASGNIFSVDNNCYSVDAGETLAVYNGTTYTDVNIDSLDTNAIVLDPLFVDPDNGNYELHADSPCVGTGVKWWGNGARPVGANGEPFPDFGIDLGANQSLHNPNHPYNL